MTDRVTLAGYEAALVLEMARAQVQTLSWVGDVRRRLFSWVQIHGLRTGA